MQLSPGEIFSIVRQLVDPLDTGTYYVQAKVRNARTDELIRTVDLVSTGSQRYKADISVPADLTGEGSYIDIETMVYVDAGHTQVSDVYQRENAVYLVQDRSRIGMGGGLGGGGGTDVDYKRIGTIFRGILQELPKPRARSKKIDLDPLEDRIVGLLKELQEAVESIDVPDHANAFKGIVMAIEEAKTGILEAVEAKAVTPETDYDRIQGMFSGLGEDIKEFVNGASTDLISIRDSFAKTINSITSGFSAMSDRFSKIPYVVMNEQPQEPIAIEKNETDPVDRGAGRKRMRGESPKTTQSGSVVLGVILIASIMSIFGVVAYRSHQIREVPKEIVADPILGDSVGTLDQFTSTSSPTFAITQRSYGKAIKITGLSDGCLGLLSSIVTSTGIPCGSGSGSSLSTTTPWTTGQLAQVVDNGTVRSIATSSLGLLTTNVAEGSNLYFTNNRVADYINASTTLPARFNYWTKSGSDLSYLAGKVGVGTATPGAQVDILSSTFPLNVGSTFAESANPSLGVYYTSSGNLFQFAADTNKAFLSGFAGKAIAIAANGFANRNSGITINADNTFTVGSLSTGIVKSTSGTLSNATAGTDYQSPITLTTTGTSGASTFVGNTLNIPQYAGTTYSSTYPILLTGSVFSLAFGTTTTNTWSNLQTFTSGFISSASSTVLGNFTIASGASGTTTVQIGESAHPACTVTRDTDNGGFTYSYTLDGITYVDTTSCE